MSRGNSWLSTGNHTWWYVRHPVNAFPTRWRGIIAGWTLTLVTVACDSGRLLYFGRVSFLNFFFRPPNFRCPWADFRETFATRRGMYLLWGVRMCPLTNLRGKNPTFWRFSDPKSRLWAPPFHTARKIGKSKTIASICGYVSTSIPNMVGSPHPSLRSAAPWCGGWGR